MRSGPALSRARPSIGLALALAVAACGGTGSPSQPGEPFETDDVPVVTPTATQVDNPIETPSDVLPPSSDNGNGWPVTVSVTIAGADSTNSNGTYSATGPARVCGNALASIAPDAHYFTFEFPLDGKFNPRDIAFTADDLLPGTTTTLFHIGVSIVNSEGHEPPSTVVTAEDPTSGDTGTATVTEADGKRTLVVNATNDFGESITLTAVCGPAPG